MGSLSTAVLWVYIFFAKMKYYSFNKYLREKFGKRVQRISINAGFGCPNLDGRLSKKGCIYCNNRGFSRYAGINKSVREQIEESIDFYQTKRGIKKFIAYFQSFTNTYAHIDVLRDVYGIIKDYPSIKGLFISTRPDCIDDDKLRLIASFQNEYLVWIEYGLQSTDNKILKYINRNHTYEDFLYALELTRKYRINVGVHLILGLEGQDYNKEAKNISRLDIQGIKFHVLHVLKNTELEKMYLCGQVRLLKKDEYVNIICDFLELLPPNMVVLRLVSDAFSDYLVAPSWINDKLEVIRDIDEEFKKRDTAQGYYYEGYYSQSK